MTPVLVPISEDESETFAHEFRLYLGEIAPNVPVDSEQIVARCFRDKRRQAFWIMAENDRAGFALTFDLPGGPRELSEFSVLPSFRRRGIGKAAAHTLFLRFPGAWTFGVSAGSPHAAAFWQSCLDGCPEMVDLRRSAPKTLHQTHSFSFTIARRQS